MKRMKRLYPLLALMAMATLAPSCDDGRIYEEEIHVTRSGGSLRLSGQISGIDTWPGGYSVVLAGFEEENEYAQTAKGISHDPDGRIDMTLTGIPDNVTQVEVCVINRLRKRVATLYSAPFERQADTTRLDAGEIDARMYGAIQRDVFDRSCTACHGGGTSAAAGLYLTEGRSYEALVNVVADLSPDTALLVSPGDAAGSFLPLVLREHMIGYDHTQIITSNTLLSLIDDWIDAGAPE